MGIIPKIAPGFSGDNIAMTIEIKEIGEIVTTLHTRVCDVFFNTVDAGQYSQDLLTSHIKEMLAIEGISLDDISEKLLSISELLLDYYHHFVALNRQTREKNQLFINDVLQQINKNILTPLIEQRYPMAMVFQRSSQWLAFILLPRYKGNIPLFNQRIRAVAEYSAEASAIVLIVMASRVRQGKHQFKYINFLYQYIPLLTSLMIKDLDNLFSNQNHANAKRMAFSLINGLMVPVRDRSEYYKALNQWKRVWHNRGVDPSKIINEIFARFPEFIHAERLQSRFVGGFASGEDIRFIAKLAHTGATLQTKSLYEVLTDAHSAATEEGATLQARSGWLGVPFEVDHIKEYVGYQQKTGLEGLFNIWSLGRSFENELILQARRLGFRGHVIKYGRNVPFHGYKAVEISPPASFDYLKTMFIYQMGAYENLIQHAGGNGVFIWRETFHGYEFIMFDHGRGVRDTGESPPSLGKLRTIFNYGVTFRKGKKGPGRTHKASGLGQSFFYLANETYLTRLISVTKDRTIRIIEKKHPGKDQGETIETVGAEFSFEELGFDYRYATGVIIQGFVPFDPCYQSVEYMTISPHSILGEVVVRNSEGRYRGCWQDDPPNDILDRLAPRDNVEFALCEGEEVDTTRSFTKTVAHLPTEAFPRFFFTDDSSFAISGIIRLEMNGREVTFSDSGDPLKTVNSLGISVFDEITIYSRSKSVRQRERIVNGYIEEVPSSYNQGTFVVTGADGRKIFIGPEQVLEVHRIPPG